MTTGLVADFARTEVCLCIIQLTVFQKIPTTQKAEKLEKIWETPP